MMTGGYTGKGQKVKIPKEIAEKMETVNKLNGEIISWMKENLNLEGAEVPDDPAYEIVISPSGEETEEGEWCQQYTLGEDWYRGTYYWPIEDSKKIFCYGL